MYESLKGHAKQEDTSNVNNVCARNESNSSLRRKLRWWRESLVYSNWCLGSDHDENIVHVANNKHRFPEADLCYSDATNTVYTKIAATCVIYEIIL